MSLPTQSVLLVTGLLTGSVAYCQTLYSIQVNSGQAVGVLSTVADVTDTNVIVIGDPLLKLSASFDALPKDELLRQLAKAAGLVHTEVEGTHILSPSDCTPSETGVTPPLSEERVSFNFVTVSPSVLVAILADFNNLQYSNSPAELAKPTHLVTVRLKNVPSSTVYKVLSKVSGTRLSPVGDSFYRIVEPIAAPCGSPAVASEVRESIQRARESRTSEYCPRREHDVSRGIKFPPKCSALERFDVDDLLVRGWVQRDSRRFALIEAPDGLTYAVKQGDYVGYHYGYISNIGLDGITVREIRLDLLNYYRERPLRLDWSGHVERIEPSAR
jgi:hypothetical protein